MDMTDVAIGQWRVVIGRDAQFAQRNGLAHADQPECIAAGALQHFGACAHGQFVAVELHGPISATHGREADGQRGLGQAIDREHGVAVQGLAGQARQELFAQFHRNGLGTVKDETHG